MSEWTEPEELKKAREAAEGGGAAAAAVAGTEGAPAAAMAKAAKAAAPAAAESASQGTASQSSDSGSMVAPAGSQPAAESAAASAAKPQAVEQAAESAHTGSVAVVAFKSMLELAGVLSDSTWEQAMRACCAEEGYDALRTLHEKRSAFREYCETRRTADASLRREKDEEERAAAKRASEEFFSLLCSREDITARTTWQQMRAMLAGQSALLEQEAPLQVLHMFERRIVQLEESENDAKAATEQAKYRRDRHLREEFRAFLGEQKAAGQIDAVTTWVAFKLMALTGPGTGSKLYRQMQLSGGSCAVELFQDMVEECADAMREEFKLEVLHARMLLSSVRTTIQSDTDFGSFERAIRAAAGADGMASPAWLVALDGADDALVRMQALHEEFVTKAKEREAEESHQRERASRRFIELLKDYRRDIEPGITIGAGGVELGAAATWGDGPRALLSRHSAYKALDDATMATLFSEYVQKLGLRELERAQRKRPAEEGAEGGSGEKPARKR